MLTFEDINAIIQLKYVRSRLYDRKVEGPQLERCWELLRLTSRSFSAVIEELHPQLRNPMMIFYLILRGLDTIEDDTGLNPEFKIPLLRNFSKTVLPTKDWTFHESSETEKDRVVLQEFDVILGQYHNLRLEYQEIIADITNKMGVGMADYATKESQTNYNGLATIKDYDIYCHHVAGIVGEGITRMVMIAKFGDQTLVDRPELYESMGQFLQKTNIIRDYREDLDEGRSFWPQEVWTKYAKNLKDFQTDPVAGQHCVSHLTVLSLRRVIHCLEYLALIKEESVFRFCAIPQIMSVATLELVFNNPQVFKRNVKISKGLACRLILAASEMRPIYAIFRDFVMLIHQRNKVSDPNYFAIEQECSAIIRYINDHDPDCMEYKLRVSFNEGRRATSLFNFFALSDEEIEKAKLMAFAVVFCLGVIGLMMGFGYMLGARYPNPIALAMEHFQKPAVPSPDMDQ